MSCRSLGSAATPGPPAIRPDAAGAWRGSFLAAGATIAVFVFVFVCVFRGRYRIDAGQPAVEIDVRAPPRAERTETLDLRLAADGAGCGMLRQRHRPPLAG